MVNQDFVELVHSKYSNAVKDGSVKFTETTSKKLKDKCSGMPYYVSLAKSLMAKDKDSNKDVDPFESPEDSMVVNSDINGDGKLQLLLNKYPVVEDHLILATKKFVKQDSILTPNELQTAYKLICDLDDEDENTRHLMFYNCGPESGSSQDHKHLQIIKLPQNFITFQDKLCNGKEHFLPNIQDEPLQDNKVAFAHFVLPLPEDPTKVSEDLLAMCFVSLLQRTLTFFQDWLNEKPNRKTSYNVLLTKNWICLVPRSNANSLQGYINLKKEQELEAQKIAEQKAKVEAEMAKSEKDKIEEINDDESKKEEPKKEEPKQEESKKEENNEEPDEEPAETIDLSLNALGYVGLVLVKDEELMNKIVELPDLIDQALYHCGFPNTSGQRPGEYNY